MIDILRIGKKSIFKEFCTNLFVPQPIGLPADVEVHRHDLDSGQTRRGLPPVRWQRLPRRADVLQGEDLPQGWFLFQARIF